MNQVNQAIEAILNHANSKLETSKNSNIFSQGCVHSAKETLSAFSEYTVKCRDEYTDLVRQEKMTVDHANFVLSQLRNVSIFLEEKYKEYEKVNYVKQGELLSNNAQVNELKGLLRDLNKPADPPPVALAEETPPAQPIQETVPTSPVTTKKRPDELDTKIGVAARDVKNRRKEAQMSVAPSSAETKRPGRPRK